MDEYVEEDEVPVETEEEKAERERVSFPFTDCLSGIFNKLMCSLL